MFHIDIMHVIFFQVQEVKDVYRQLRDDVEGNFSEIYTQATNLAEKVGVEPAAPRVARRQANRGNNPSVTVEHHFRVNLAIPFLDNIIENLESKFDGIHVKILHILSIYVFSHLRNGADSFNASWFNSERDVFV